MYQGCIFRRREIKSKRGISDSINQLSQGPKWILTYFSRNRSKKKGMRLYLQGQKGIFYLSGCGIPTCQASGEAFFIV